MPITGLKKQCENFTGNYVLLIHSNLTSIHKEEIKRRKEVLRFKRRDKKNIFVTIMLH